MQVKLRVITHQLFKLVSLCVLGGKMDKSMWKEDVELKFSNFMHIYSSLLDRLAAQDIGYVVPGMALGLWKAEQDMNLAELRQFFDDIAHVLGKDRKDITEQEFANVPPELFVYICAGWEKYLGLKGDEDLMEMADILMKKINEPIKDKDFEVWARFQLRLIITMDELMKRGVQLPLPGEKESDRYHY